MRTAVERPLSDKPSSTISPPASEQTKPASTNGSALNLDDIFPQVAATTVNSISQSMDLCASPTVALLFATYVASIASLVLAGEDELIASAAAHVALVGQIAHGHMNLHTNSL